MKLINRKPKYTWQGSMTLVQVEALKDVFNKAASLEVDGKLTLVWVTPDWLIDLENKVLYYQKEI